MLKSTLIRCLIKQMKIEELHEKWKQATRFDSALSTVVQNEYYQAIIDRGDEALEYILKELDENRDDPDWWFPALTEITGENPVHERHAGQTKKMAMDWIRWGVRNEIIDTEVDYSVYHEDMEFDPPEGYLEYKPLAPHWDIGE